MNKLCTRAALLVLVAGAVASVASCGGAAMDAKAPGSAPGEKDGDASASTPEAALAQLDVAERDLARALGYPAPEALAQAPLATSMPQAGPPPPPSPPRPAEPSPRTYAEPPAQPGAAPSAGGRDAKRTEREGPSRGAEPCSTACSALASMERSADHLCNLTGAADNRCASARERVKNASARVSAACPACAR